MMRPPTQDALFDLDELARAAVAETPWAGAAPLGYTTQYFAPAELDAAMDRWRAEHGTFGSHGFSHMWHRDLFDRPFEARGHRLVRFSAETRCDCPDHDHSADPLPGALMFQAICPDCRWHAIGSENEIVEAWHDHAMPGWRDLPVMPTFRSRDERKQRAAQLRWLAETYPAEWQLPGAPVITQRTPHGTRHVPDRSPLGGYDLAATPRPEGDLS